MWELLALAAVAFGGLGAWIGVQKQRGGSEGFVLGLLFGPLGVLVELFLPQGEEVADGPTRRNIDDPRGMRSTILGRSAVGSPTRRNIDDLGAIASMADRFRTALDEADPAWERLPYHRKRSLLKPIEKRVGKELGLSPTQFADFAAEARRLLFRSEDRTQ
jgi:hypothetical protein